MENLLPTYPLFCKIKKEGVKFLKRKQVMSSREKIIIITTFFQKLETLITVSSPVSRCPFLGNIGTLKRDHGVKGYSQHHWRYSKIAHYERKIRNLWIGISTYHFTILTCFNSMEHKSLSSEVSSSSSWISATFAIDPSRQISPSNNVFDTNSDICFAIGDRFLNLFLEGAPQNHHLRTLLGQHEALPQIFKCHFRADIQARP